MLDYNKLSEEFTKRLNSFDKEKLAEWIDFDSDRISITNIKRIDGNKPKTTDKLY